MKFEATTREDACFTIIFGYNRRRDGELAGANPGQSLTTTDWIRPLLVIRLLPIPLLPTTTFDPVIARAIPDGQTIACVPACRITRDRHRTSVPRQPG